jgi:serine/threonine-protein kinase
VAAATYFAATWFARPIKLLGESMAEIAKGRFDHRINERRKDEFGQLYQAFDAMAAALQEREVAPDAGGLTPPVAQAAATPGPATPAPPTVAQEPPAPTRPI